MANAQWILPIDTDGSFDLSSAEALPLQIVMSLYDRIAAYPEYHDGEHNAVVEQWGENWNLTSSFCWYAVKERKHNDV